MELNGFDSDRYTAAIGKDTGEKKHFGGKLYLEFGGNFSTTSMQRGSARI